MCLLSLVQFFNTGTDNYESLILSRLGKKVFILFVCLLVYFFDTPTSGDFVNVFKTSKSLIKIGR